MFFPLHFWGVNNMYWESEGGEFLHPWRKGGVTILVEDYPEFFYFCLATLTRVTPQVSDRD